MNRLDREGLADRGKGMGPAHTRTSGFRLALPGSSWKDSFSRMSEFFLPRPTQETHC